MRPIKTKFNGLLVFKGKTFYDQRGFLRETYKQKLIKKNLKFTILSKSKKNVLRGLHLQTKNSQAKYISVLKGKVLDVAVDLRKNSNTYKKHFKIILSDKNSTSVFLPKGFAHGFLALDNENIVMYGCSNYRSKIHERSILWNDKDLKIKWGVKKPIVSKKDKKALSLKAFLKN
tara:strand:- start:1652 stop:2173 length:522 start_codon:yes stop_codon:yes gene_type:complete